MNPKDFFQKVYKVVKMIPSGRVSTYGLIAKYLGSEKSSRVVGYAMNASHNLEDVPAHRVVNRTGLLTGKHHFAGTNLMKDLLESEGVKIFENTVLDFENVVWDPSKELN
ncbi:MAG: MGMT family protein [Flavobacteriaceae bacterium]|nr:MAG: methylated-DNA--[protein]-cysteine S-methyltransferase [Bacteroidota bacterium]|tara:strand:+ start:220 stop:549 length:330 start_codon:yes stop_codon:yes gene_type:complete